MTTQTMNIIAVVSGPIFAVIISLWYQKRKHKQDIKHRVFLTLMAHRKSNPPHPALVEALNTLDVIFSKNNQVLKAWKDYFDLLSTPNPDSRTFDAQNRAQLDLLSAIASDLGYKKLRQTTIDCYYRTQAQAEQGKILAEIQTEFLRVLKNTESLVAEPRYKV